MEQQNTEKNVSLIDEICDWIHTILFALFVILIIFTFVCKQVRVDGISMMNTLVNDDRLLVSNWFYSPEVGDIVVVRSEGLQKDIVKRIVATPGQKVDIDFNQGIVYVDDVAIDEPYIAEPTYLDEYGHDYPVIVPEDSYFVLGDNRNHSTDSRDSRVGFVPREDIVGKTIFRIYPFDSFGVVE